MRPAEPDADLLPAADPGPERRGPVVRGTRHRRAVGRDRRPPCPPASPSPDPSESRAAVRGADADARTDAGPTPTPTPTPEPTPTPDADADADPEPAANRPPREPPAVRRLTGGWTDAVVEVRGLLVRRAGRTILGPLDWTVRAGERWVVLGPNGSGKTTLCPIVGLDLWPTAGTVEVLGERYGRVDARELRRRIGSPGAPSRASLRAGPDARSTLVMTARHAATEPWWHVYTDDDRARARGAARRARLGRVADQPFGTLSAGERRRTSIARALMPDPDLLLLDEPAASLDLGARETLIARPGRLAAAPRPSAIVLVSHHVEEIPPGFTHALVLADGAVVAAGPIDEVLRERGPEPRVRPADRGRARRDGPDALGDRRRCATRERHTDAR